MGVRYVKTYSSRGVPEQYRSLYRQMKREFGMVAEPFLIHSIRPRAMAAIWAVVRETVLIEGAVSREQKELIASCVSKSNECPYCVDAHALVLVGTGDSSYYDFEKKISQDQTNPLQQWALATKNPESLIIQTPPFGHEQAPEMIGTAVAFHYINKLVSVFLDQSPIPTQNQVLKKLFQPMVAFVFSLAVKRNKIPGEALNSFPSEDLPKELSWAIPNPHVAQSFAYCSLVMEAWGEETLPKSVRTEFLKYVNRWDGSDPGMGRGWIVPMLNKLSRENDRRLLEFILLGAFAPYQLDEGYVIKAKRELGSDDALVGALAWASFAVAARIGGWLAKPFILNDQVNDSSAFY